jgi:hypothetical protein
MVRINFAEIEEYEKLPKGKYHFAITDLEVDEHGESAKHPGNEYWRATLTVQSGELQGKTQNLMITLPPYEPFTLVGILRATVGQHEWTEEQVKEGDLDVDIDDLEGLEFVASVRPQKNNSDFNEVRGIQPYDSEDWADADLLP